MPDRINNFGKIEMPSYEEFKKTILDLGANSDFLNRAATYHGNIPIFIRILYNLEPTGALNGMQQLLNEVKTKREQDNILQVIYNLENKICRIEESSAFILTEDKIKFLYYVYLKSNTDVYLRVEPDEIQKEMDLSQHKIISIGGYLEENGFIKFSTWVNGIHILHKGIIRIESDLLVNRELPNYISGEVIRMIDENINLRLTILKYLYKVTEADTFQMISHEGLANGLLIDHNLLLTQNLPYMEGENWLISRTCDSISITEKGIDIVNSLNVRTP